MHITHSEHLNDGHGVTEQTAQAGKTIHSAPELCTLRHKFTQPKVSEAQVACEIDQHVGWLQVTMDDRRIMVMQVPHS